MESIKTGIFRRSYELRSDDVDQDSREVGLSFSSEEGVERWFGTEILDHDPSSVRLGRLTDGGPLLVDHDPADHVGVVEKATVSKDRVGRALVRFGKSSRANEIFADVVDGIRRHISVGYRIHSMKQDDEAMRFFAPSIGSLMKSPWSASRQMPRWVSEGIRNRSLKRLSKEIQFR